MGVWIVRGCSYLTQGCLKEHEVLRRRENQATRKGTALLWQPEWLPEAVGGTVWGVGQLTCLLSCLEKLLGGVVVYQYPRVAVVNF